MVTHSDKYSEYIIEDSDREPNERTVYRFPNNYGASVVKLGMYKYPEIAVLRFYGVDIGDYNISYGTEITNDVVQGIVIIDDVLEDIKKLEENL